MIFYFSGTGNSRWVAQQLSASLNGEALVSIADALLRGENSYTIAPDERIGFVFPVHSWGPPPVVLDFISRLTINGRSAATYLYMVCTCGDDIGMTFEIWRKAVGASNNVAAFSVQMPNTYILLPGFDVDSREVEQRKLREARTRVQAIALSVAERRCSVEIVTGNMKWAKSRIVYPIFRHFGITDRPFKVDASLCVECGACVRSCPMHNIEMHNSLPKWQGNCTSCLACIHNCAPRAIQFGSVTQKKGRYRFSEPK